VRCAVRAAFSGATYTVIHCESHILDHSFSPLNAGWDGAARHSYQVVEDVPFMLARPELTL
jgi:hypothetical protein